MRAELFAQRTIPFVPSVNCVVRNWYETFYRNVLIVAILDDDDDAAILHSLNRQCCLRCMFIFDLTLVDRSRQARGDNSVALRRRFDRSRRAGARVR